MATGYDETSDKNVEDAEDAYACFRHEHFFCFFIQAPSPFRICSGRYLPRGNAVKHHYLWRWWLYICLWASKPRPCSQSSSECSNNDCIHNWRDFDVPSPSSTDYLQAKDFDWVNAGLVAVPFSSLMDPRSQYCNGNGKANNGHTCKRTCEERNCGANSKAEASPLPTKLLPSKKGENFFL